MLRHLPYFAKPSSRYPLAMADVQEQLQEIGAQLDWVRDYL